MASLNRREGVCSLDRGLKEGLLLRASRDRGLTFGLLGIWSPPRLGLKVGLEIDSAPRVPGLGLRGAEFGGEDDSGRNASNET